MEMHGIVIPQKLHVCIDSDKAQQLFRKASLQHRVRNKHTHTHNDKKSLGEVPRVSHRVLKQTAANGCERLRIKTQC